MSNSVTVTIRQGRCSTTVETFGSGEPLLYLHGPFGFVEREFVENLARDFQVYVPAHPGYEGTTGFQEIDATVFDLMLYYDDVIEALNLPTPVRVAGHSLGAFIGAELAAVYPVRVRQLGLISPLGVWCDSRPQPDLFGLTPRTLAAELFHDPAGPAARSMLWPPEDREAAGQWNRARRQSAIGSAKYLWPLPDKGFRHRAYRVKAPTLLLWGAGDKVVPPDPYLTTYEGLLASTTAELCPDAGHMVVLEQPREAARLLAKHFKNGG